MLSEIIIGKLAEFITRYPYEKMHKLLVTFILSRLEIRKHEEYLLEWASIANDFYRLIVDKAEKEVDNVRDEFIDDLHGLGMIFLHIQNLSDNEADAVKEYCIKMIPVQEDTLEEYLQRNLSVGKLDYQLIWERLHGEALLFLGRIAAVSGFYDENFTLLPDKEISNETLSRIIKDYFEKRGYVSIGKGNFSHDFFHLILDKGDEYVDVSVSNYSNRILVSIHMSAC